MSSDIKTIGDVRILVSMLSWRFNVPLPIVTDTNRKNSAIHFSKGELRITPKDWHGLENATLHEFAHWLLFKRLGVRIHNLEFFKTLTEIVLYWKGDLRAYRWHLEYRRIWKYAHDCRYTSRSWAGDKWP